MQKSRDGDKLGVNEKPKKKKNKKDSQLVLRLDQQERDEFVALCKEMDTSAAREIRHFIRRYIKEHREE